MNRIQHHGWRLTQTQESVRNHPMSKPTLERSVQAEEKMNFARFDSVVRLQITGVNVPSNANYYAAWRVQTRGKAKL